ncbi:FtsW/RodA/SpoVE family cell cycle protein [Bacillus pacificus]
MKKTPDFILIIVTLALLTIGMIMVYSASAVWASYKMGDSFFFAKKAIAIRRSWCSGYVFYYEN